VTGGRRGWEGVPDAGPAGRQWQRGRRRRRYRSSLSRRTCRRLLWLTQGPAAPCWPVRPGSSLSLGPSPFPGGSLRRLLPFGLAAGGAPALVPAVPSPAAAGAPPASA